MPLAPMLPALKAAKQRLAGAGIATADLDAELLLAHLLGVPRLELYRMHDRVLSDVEAAGFDAFISRRTGHEPVAYITGSQEFWGLDFTVTRHTLIPRQDTETLVEVVLARTRGLTPRTLLDLGSGTGCISLSLAHEIPALHVTCADISDGALAVVRENAKRLDLSGRTATVRSDWFSAVDVPSGGFDIIVSNPPYIPSADIAGLMADVQDHEPMSALDGGPDGLAPYRHIVAEAPAHLAENGLLAVEVGIGQARDVAALMANAGFHAIDIKRDLPGIERVVAGQKS